MNGNHQVSSKGQVMITMLYIMVIGILVTTGAAFAMIGSMQSTTSYDVGMIAYAAAESGTENALLRLIRDPFYTGETFAVDAQSSVTVSVATSSGIVITSSGKAGTAVRQIETKIHYTGGMLIVDSWKELP